jgi:2-polyprenyl-3-methyl-5-hydroxy-6-metoxy-1,4-benzoquinol methylase
MILDVNNNLRFNNCPLCKSLEIFQINNIVYNKPTYFSSNEIILSKQPELWRCRYCGSNFVQNVIPQEIAKVLYCQGASDQRWKSEAFQESKSIPLIKILQSLFQKNLKVLDIGCNTGELLDFARLQGCYTFGIEYSESSHNFLKEKGHIIFADIVNINERFDIITAFDLIEHLYNVPDFLNSCFNQLLPGGYLIIFTGNIMCLTARFLKGKWWYVCWPEHIVFPSIKYFETQSKFKVVNYLNTYHSKYFKINLSLSVKNILKGQYSGIPPFQSDHMLMILKKSNFGSSVPDIPNN